MADDVQILIRKLKEQGFTVAQAKNSHYKVYKDGRLVGTLPATPGDWRSLRNSIAVLRRNGFVYKGR